MGRVRQGMQTRRHEDTQYVRLIKRLNRGEVLDSYSGAAVAITLILAILGLAMVINLVLLR